MTKRPMINEALRLVRHYWGYTQKDLAETLEVTQSLVSDIENGQKSVSLDLLERYSAALGIRMSQLLFFAEELENEPIQRRGKLFIADKVLRLLDKLKPQERAEA